MAMLSLVFTPLLLTFIPCDQESDFQGTRKFTGTVKCNDVFSANSWYINRYYPASAKDCNTRPPHDGADTKARFVEISYSRCCKPGSKPNGVCGLKKGSLPCDQVSDFLSEKDLSPGVKCRDAYYLGQLSAAGKCNEIPSGLKNGPSNAAMLKSLYASCCRPGSKPNGICGFKKMDTTTPCKSKSVGEFLPGAW